MSRGTLMIPAGDWQTVLHTPTSLVLYNPPSHALTVLPHPFPSAPSSPLVIGRGREENVRSSPSREDEDEVEADESRCPYCKRPMAEGEGGINVPSSSANTDLFPQPTARYFSILSQANTPLASPRRRPPRARAVSGTVPSVFGGRSSSPIGSETSAFVDEYESDEPLRSNGSTKRSRSGGRGDSDKSEAGASNAGADGYYDRFFKEEGRLGMGAQGSVFLCQHILDSQPLGLYAVKKVAVGDSHDYLLKVLREVQLLQTLRHENIVTYHHAWIERTRFSSFGPKVQALHILMQFASSGSLEDFILTRTLPPPSASDASSPLDAFHLAELSPEDAKAAIRARRTSKGAAGAPKKGGFLNGVLGVGGAGGERRAVRLLGREEVEGIFGGVVKGLGYLHDHGILHLDLKCSNVLLHQEEGDLIPRALISDFGTSRAVVYGRGAAEEARRSGNTGTLEYCSPESLLVDREGRLLELGREGDLWSLGMVLYKLLFFKLPYSQIEDFDLLASDIKAYEGFTPTPALVASFQRRGLPRELLHILSGLLNVDPRRRPSCEQVLTILKEGMKDDPFHFPESYGSELDDDPLKSLAPFVPPRYSPPTFAPVVEDDGETDYAFGRQRGRSDSAGSMDSVRTEIPATITNLPFGRILLPPPYPSRFPSPAWMQHLPTLVVLLKFLALHLFSPRTPSLGLQVSVLALALVGAGRRRSGVLGNEVGRVDGSEGRSGWARSARWREEAGLVLGQVGLMMVLGGLGGGWRMGRW